MPGTASMHTDFTAEVYMLEMDEGGRARSFPNHYQPKFSFHRMDVKGSISFPGESIPGDNLSITVKLIVWTVIEEGLHFTIHEGGNILGFGVTLFDSGKVDVCSKDNLDRTPLLLAILIGDEAILDLLLGEDNIGVDSKKTGWTPLSRDNQERTHCS
ncbi:elongation factor Tu [Penicillium waksmanii]|uniref:elongation factor Tu n=1 Tax=Penicillium waksmanii TaxID=69791 RepID=UPI0025471283|nr:elongation factor Tu [Penicillium waksmanii]KAJ5984494.1 elongation factor Tu [Penicillium waksmanii]